MDDEYLTVRTRGPSGEMGGGGSTERGPKVRSSAVAVSPLVNVTRASASGVAVGGEPYEPDAKGREKRYLGIEGADRVTGMDVLVWRFGADDEPSSWRERDVLERTLEAIE